MELILLFSFLVIGWGAWRRGQRMRKRDNDTQELLAYVRAQKAKEATT